MIDLLSPLTLSRGPSLKNRFMLAPLTNTQSFDDGRLSEEEYRWLTMRAQGGFGLTMTCASHVQAIGKGFPGQLGVFSDDHLEGLKRLSSKIKASGSVAICQIHHAGMRSPEELIGQKPVCPSNNKEFNARALSYDEVENLRDDFIKAAIRSEQAGFDGVELHGAHGYILAQFLSPEINQRDDQYGQSLSNRSRLLYEIIDGIRRECNKDFILGVRLSPERFGLRLNEITILAEELMTSGKIDFLDMSLWDVFKEPEDEAFKGKKLISYFSELRRGNTRLGVAGSIKTPRDAEKTMAEGVDWIMLGRAGMLHHNFPKMYEADRNFTPIEIPVTEEYLMNEGLSEKFIQYIEKWGFT
ncbi:NADH:flavin oxidoreductase [Candidatus Thioglobus sp.]|nr:NADH:flavin oxidoreductase [Candidatus Thioglobus sp.]